MTGHAIGHPYRLYNTTRTLYCLAADCECGVTVHGMSLHREVWPKHAEHVALARVQALRGDA